MVQYTSPRIELTTPLSSLKFKFRLDELFIKLNLVTVEDLILISNRLFVSQNTTTINGISEGLKNRIRLFLEHNGLYTLARVMSGINWIFDQEESWEGSKFKQYSGTKMNQGKTGYNYDRKAIYFKHRDFLVFGYDETRTTKVLEGSSKRSEVSKINKVIVFSTRDYTIFKPRGYDPRNRFVFDSMEDALIDLDLAIIKPVDESKVFEARSIHHTRFIQQIKREERNVHTNT